MPVEQPRNRKREIPQTNRRTNALKHQHINPTNQAHPPGGPFSSSKLGHVNGVNVISQGSSTAACSSGKASNLFGNPSSNPTSKYLHESLSFELCYNIYYHSLKVGDHVIHPPPPPVQCLKPRPATTSNLDYMVSPKSVLLQPKLLNTNIGGELSKTLIQKQSI